MSRCVGRTVKCVGWRKCRAARQTELQGQTQLTLESHRNNVSQARGLADARRASRSAEADKQTRRGVYGAGNDGDKHFDALNQRPSARLRRISGLVKHQRELKVI